MSYELWDRPSRNLIESFDSLTDLLKALRTMNLEGVGLALRDERGDTIWADPTVFTAAFYP